MINQLPTIQDYRGMIKALQSQRDVLDKQISALEMAIQAQECTIVAVPLKKKRNRPETEETKILKENVRQVFIKNRANSMKLIDVIRQTTDLYSEDEKVDEQTMRGRFANLRKIRFILPVSDHYGYIKLFKTLKFANESFQEGVQEGDENRVEVIPF